VNRNTALLFKTATLTNQTSSFLCRCYQKKELGSLGTSQHIETLSSNLTIKRLFFLSCLSARPTLPQYLPLWPTFPVYLRLYLSFSLQISITFNSTDQNLKRDTLVKWPTAQKLQSIIWHDFEPIPCIFHQHCLFTSDESSCHPQRTCYFCKKLLLRYTFTHRSTQIVRLPCCTPRVCVCVCVCIYVCVCTQWYLG